MILYLSGTSHWSKKEVWLEPLKADEATLDKKELSGNEEHSDPSKAVAWEKCLLERGKPETWCCTASSQKNRSLGASEQSESWKWLRYSKIILHTGSAKSYKAKVRGILDNNVIRQKKRVKARGKWTWQCHICEACPAQGSQNGNPSK